MNQFKKYQWVLFAFLLFSNGAAFAQEEYGNYICGKYVVEFSDVNGVGYLSAKVAPYYKEAGYVGVEEEGYAIRQEFRKDLKAIYFLKSLELRFYPYHVQLVTPRYTAPCKKLVD